MLTELLQIFLAPGIAMPPTTSLLFRTLAILEGTLRALCPGYPSSHPPRTSPLNWYEASVNSGSPRSAIT